MNSNRAQLVVPVGPDDHVEGSDDAAITIVEYGDFQCPYCGQAYPIVKRLQSDFGDSLRLVFRNMPLTNVHPQAELAAETAEAVGLQGKFWPMHDVLFENQRDLSGPALLRYVEDVGADLSQVANALNDGVVQKRVKDDVESGIRSGVNGTPTFFVNGERYDGSWDYESFHAYLQDVLDQP
ncbi:MAG TPA: thioredoxin domain-containing protein [Acidimicrobiales bacterium]|nr:thioredoxin domain-containing protein [Acidimicrobiales bacterium]